MIADDTLAVQNPGALYALGLFAVACLIWLWWPWR